ncbi:MAG: cell division protein FtsL [Clostridiales bacterium]|nr:cell division protein FtsL [Clostridiales bacterium]
MDVKTDILEQPLKKPSKRIQKNREKVFHMSIGYVMFLSAALFLSALVLLLYINLQAQISTSVQNISMLESKLNGLKLENDEEYNRIVTSVDLEEIKRIAIEELGMTYASQGQIIVLDNEGSDYVRQYSQIP